MLLTTILFSSLIGSPQLERPHLTLAQGYIESNMNRKAVGKKGEKGAWQVREKYWGKVPKDLLGQAKQAERILNGRSLENCNSMHIALIRYNGRGRAAVLYANKVRQKAIEIALMFV